MYLLFTFSMPTRHLNNDGTLTYVEDSFRGKVEQTGGTVGRRFVDMARAQACCHDVHY